MAATSCTGIISNPDLAGIGIRLNFYVTVLLTALIPQKGYTDELLDSLYLNAIFYGLALLITALVQTIQRQLDLYHAIIVMQVILSLQFLHGFGMRRYILANKKEFRIKMKLTIAIQILSLLIFYPWSFYMWINAPRFGDCLWARYLCMTILAMTTFALLCNLIVIFAVYKVHKVVQPPSDDGSDSEKGNEPSLEPANKTKTLAKKWGRR
ncbi:hypothetical protein EDB84DRAFT_1581680 [Lactarius hengduanensis]|nr:hypothetical protein EDB84DRAFT_1581680 [Lactarius hengduanensis]